MSVKNKWLSPYQRSYQQIKEKLIDDLSKITDSDGNQLITDFSEGNILIIILSMFSAIAEVLHYYIDNMARETFLPTARRYESIVKQGALVDYHPKAAIASTVDVKLTRPLSSNSKGQILTIPKNTEFTDENGNSWLSNKDVTWNTNVSYCIIPLIQHTKYYIDDLIGTPIPSGDTIQVSLGTLPDGLYEQGSLYLTIDNIPWKIVETFAYSKPTDHHCMVQVTNEDIPVIVFGDGTFGAKPESGKLITSLSCYVTNGSKGNVESASINSVPNSISISISDATCSNVNEAAGGSDYEDFNMLKRRIPLSVKTLGVAVTKQDFIDLAKQIDGVDKVKMDYISGRKMDIYISPDNGVIASSILLNRVYEHLIKFAPLSTLLNIKSAGKSDIILSMEVTGRKSFTSQEIQDQILQALYDKYSPEASDIGASIRISDIYALIDNLSMVDYLRITKFYIKPWPITIIGGKSLDFSTFSIDTITKTTTYYIYFDTDTTYTIRSVIGGFVQTGIPLTSTIIKDTKNGNIFSMAFADDSYNQGSKYQFTISEPNLDYNDPGFNIPIFDNPNQINLKINETL